MFGACFFSQGNNVGFWNKTKPPKKKTVKRFFFVPLEIVEDECR